MDFLGTQNRKRVSTIIYTIMGILTLFLANNVHSATPSFEDINSAAFGDIVEELSANFIHHPVSPASVTGQKLMPLLGIEFGVVGGITKTPKIDGKVPGEDLGSFPHAGGLLSLSTVYGLGLELILFPERSFSDVTLSYTSVGLKWTFSQLFPLPLPVDLAFRLHYSKPEVSFKQTINSEQVDVNYDGKIWGFNVAASTNFLPVLEPYVGLGYVKGKGTINYSSDTNIPFVDDLVGQQSATSSKGSMLAYVGGQFNLLFINLAVELATAYGTKSYNGKLSFDF